MAIAFRSETDGRATGTCSVTTFTVTAPAGAVSGDIFVLIVNLEQSCCGAPSNCSTPTGWTRHFFASGYTTNTSAALYTCKYASGTTGLTFTVTESLNPTTVNWSWGCSAYSGCDQTTWNDATPTSSTNASSTNLTAASITTATANAMVLNLYAYNGTGTITDAASTTQRINRQNAAGSVYSAEELFAAAGATGTRVATIVGAKVSRGYSVALRPAASAGFNPGWAYGATKTIGGVF